MRTNPSARIVAIAALALLTTAQPALPFGRDGFTQLHANITREALPFMRGWIVDSVVKGNLEQDVLSSEEGCDQHACNCRFRDSVNYYNKRYRETVVLLGLPPRPPRLTQPPNPTLHGGASFDSTDLAAYAFGSLLHGIQDFYSHSNWIPTAPQGLNLKNRLLDTELGFWKQHGPYAVLFDDVVLIEGNAPAGTSVLLPTDSNGRVSSAVPIFTPLPAVDPVAALSDPTLSTTQLNSKARGPANTSSIGSSEAAVEVPPPRGPANTSSISGSEAAVEVPPPTTSYKQYRGLMTAGTEGDSDLRCPIVGESCDISTPENVCLRHEDGRAQSDNVLNYVGAGRMNMDKGGGGDWFSARLHAKRQTQHEWCRLLHLSRYLDPSYNSSARLLGTWVKEGGNPHIIGTACQRQRGGQHRVEVTVTTGRDVPDDATLVVFRSDFTNSGRGAIGDGDRKPMMLCANTNEDVIAAIMPTYAHGFATPFKVTGEPVEETIAAKFGTTIRFKVTPNVCR